MFNKKSFILKDYLDDNNLSLNVSFEFNTLQYVSEKTDVFGFKDSFLLITDRSNKSIMTEDEFIRLGKVALLGEDFDEINETLDRHVSKWSFSNNYKKLKQLLCDPIQLNSFLSEEFQKIQSLLNTEIKTIDHQYKKNDLIYSLSIAPVFDFDGLSSNCFSIDEFTIQSLNYSLKNNVLDDELELSTMIFVENHVKDDSPSYGRITFSRQNNGSYQFDSLYEFIKFFPTKEEAEMAKESLKSKIKEQLASL